MRTDPLVIAVTAFKDKIGHDWGGPFTALVCELDYFRPLHDRGAVGILVPSNPVSAPAILDRVDGIMLTGGSDVHPGRYRDWSGPYDKPTEQKRDEFEIQLVRHALLRNLPVLGICRGIQSLNVALGGTLRLHVPDHLHVERATEAFQRVRITPGTQLHGVMGADAVMVNSMHHQAVAEPGEGLRIVARADDGTPEGIEHGEAPMLGVQWHPEKLADPRNYEALVGWLLDKAAAWRSTFPATPNGGRDAAAPERSKADS